MVETMEITSYFFNAVSLLLIAVVSYNHHKTINNYRAINKINEDTIQTLKQTSLTQVLEYIPPALRYGNRYYHPSMSLGSIRFIPLGQSGAADLFAVKLNYRDDWTLGTLKRTDSKDVYAMLDADKFEATPSEEDITPTLQIAYELFQRHQRIAARSSSNNVPTVIRSDNIIIPHAINVPPGLRYPNKFFYRNRKECFMSLGTTADMDLFAFQRLGSKEWIIGVAGIKEGGIVDITMDADQVSSSNPIHELAMAHELFKNKVY